MSNIKQPNTLYRNHSKAKAYKRWENVIGKTKTGKLK